jgi:carbonic anhydrase
MAGAGSISVEGEDYELLQFHFHKPSEEKINPESVFKKKKVNPHGFHP